MRIYIIEDDISVISILEDIVEGGGLGSVCGDTADAPLTWTGSWPWIRI